MNIAIIGSMEAIPLTTTYAESHKILSVDVPMSVSRTHLLASEMVQVAEAHVDGQNRWVFLGWFLRFGNSWVFFKGTLVSKNIYLKKLKL